MSHSALRHPEPHSQSNRRTVRNGRILFVTGTDTGVGKTLLTALLLRHARQCGCEALATKPFCSGGLDDVRILRRAQDQALSMREINPFYFEEPVAPLVAARKSGLNVKVSDVLGRIRALASRCPLLLVEGSGGLLVPLGERFAVAELIAGLGCGIVVVARNRLGTVNHTLLTLRALRHMGLASAAVALMDMPAADLASRSNLALIRELAAPIPVFTLPFLGARPEKKPSLERHAKKLKKTLAAILELGILPEPSSKSKRKKSKESACENVEGR
jgi:dethiobiotin synthetase